MAGDWAPGGLLREAEVAPTAQAAVTVVAASEALEAAAARRLVDSGGNPGASVHRAAASGVEGCKAVTQLQHHLGWLHYPPGQPVR